MAKPLYTQLSTEAAAQFNSAVDALIVKKLGKIPGLSGDITPSGEAFSGAPQAGGQSPTKTPGIDF